MIYSLPAQVKTRLAGLLPRDVAFYASGERVDLTAEDGAAMAVKVAFARLPVDSQVSQSARQQAEFTFTLFLVEARMTPALQQQAEALFVGALQKLVGWEIAPGRECRLTDGPPTEDEAGVVAFSFGFAIPFYVNQL